MAAVLKTVLSSKGQVVLPKAIRDAKQWRPGAELVVEERPEGVLLRAAPFYPPTTIEEVFGSIPYDGPPLTIEEMDEAVLEAVAEEYRRSIGEVD